MRKPILFLAVNALILVLVFVLLVPSLFVVTRVAQVSSVQGSVEVQRRETNDWQKINTRDVIAVGDKVRTGANAEVELAWLDRTRWKLLPNTEIEVVKARMESLGKTEESHLKLKQGEMFVRLVKDLTPDSSFVIETPTARVTTRGAVAHLKLDSKQVGLQIDVLHGEAVVRDNNGGEATVIAGRTAMAGTGMVDIKTQDVAPVFQLSNMAIPALDMTVQLPRKTAGAKQDFVWLRGFTEVGNQVTINNKPAPVLGNGMFGRRSDVQDGYNEFRVKVIDKNGGEVTQCRAVTYNKKTDSLAETGCAPK